MDLTTTVSKISIKDEPYFLLIQWEDPMVFELVNKDQIWSGTFSKNEMYQFYSNLDMTVDKYIEHIKNVFLGDNSKDEFIYQIDDEKFIWKKVIDKHYGMNFVQGEVKVVYKENGGTNLIAEKLMTLKETAENRLDKNSSELVNVYSQLKILSARMDEMITEKHKMEESLYSKFLTLLNAKKEKINEMEEFLNENIKNAIIKGNAYNRSLMDPNIKDIYGPDADGSYRIY